MGPSQNHRQSAKSFARDPAATRLASENPTQVAAGNQQELTC